MRALCLVIGLVISPGGCHLRFAEVHGERCNGVDDDSDGLVDEAPCGLGFVDISVAAGVSRTLPTSSDSYGVSWADYDNDGLLDLWISHGAALFRNQGDGTFTGVVGPWMGDPFARPGFWADVDNDGDMDLFLRRSGVMELYQNEGGSFVERGVAANVASTGNIGTALWLDHDRDGDIDLFLPDGSGSNEIRSNNGDVPVTFVVRDGATLGLPYAGNGEASAVADVDDDGDLDIWHNDGVDGSLFLNDGAGAFVEASAAAGLATDMGANQPYYATCFGDYDNDGDLDAFFGHPDGTANRLYVNDGSGTFSLAPALGVDVGHSRGADWGDYDNDGDLDLYIGNDGAANVLYRNDGDGAFTDVTAVYGVAGEPSAPTATVSFADYDDDGDLDLLAMGLDSIHTLWRNELDTTAYLKVRVVGATGSPRDGIGSRVELWNADQTTLLAIREVSGGGGFGLQSPQIVQFGLAEAWGGSEATYTIRARFVNATTVTRRDVVPASERITIGATTLAQTIEVRP